MKATTKCFIYCIDHTTKVLLVQFSVRILIVEFLINLFDRLLFILHALDLRNYKLARQFNLQHSGN